MAICQQIHTDSTFPQRGEFKRKIKALFSGAGPFWNGHCGEEPIPTMTSQRNPTTSQTLDNPQMLRQALNSSSQTSLKILNHWKLIMLLLFCSMTVMQKPQKSRGKKPQWSPCPIGLFQVQVWQESNMTARRKYCMQSRDMQDSKPTSPQQRSHSRVAWLLQTRWREQALANHPRPHPCLSSCPSSWWEVDEHHSSPSHSFLTLTRFFSFNPFSREVYILSFVLFQHKMS